MDNKSEPTIKLATIKREFVDLYKSDMTYVIVSEEGESSTVKLLHFPDRPPTTVPTKHLNVFDELPNGLKNPEQ